MAKTTLRPAFQMRLVQGLPWERTLTAAELSAHLDAAGIRLNTQQWQQVWDALAIAAYHAQTGMPVVRWLLRDDAHVYHGITDTHALCWVHDGRHDAKLRPVIPAHQVLLADFRRDYWAFYRQLLTYRTAPTTTERTRLQTAFDVLVAQHTGYDDLDARIAKTAHNRDRLLAVRDHPDLPLHNNAMELAARRRVRKRDVSFGPQSQAGARAWDTCQTIAATAAKLGVRLYHYLRDRCMHPTTTPSLADRIQERSRAAACASA